MRYLLITYVKLLSILKLLKKVYKSVNGLSIVNVVANVVYEYNNNDLK